MFPAIYFCPKCVQSKYCQTKKVAKKKEPTNLLPVLTNLNTNFSKLLVRKEVQELDKEIAIIISHGWRSQGARGASAPLLFFPKLVFFIFSFFFLIDCKLT